MESSPLSVESHEFLEPRPKAIDLASHRNLSIVRPNSQNTKDSRFPVSTKTDMMLHSIGRPLQGTLNQEISDILGQEYECSHSFGRPLRGAQTQEKKTRPEFRKMEITNTECLNKVFYNLRNKLAEVQNLPEFAMETKKTNMQMWSWFYFHRWKQQYIWVRRSWQFV